MSVREAQDSIAATIPEIEKLAWRFFAIARDLEAPLDNEELADAEPGPEHLRYFTALGAMAGYTGLLEQIPLLRRTAETTHSDLCEDWQLREAHEKGGGG